MVRKRSTNLFDPHTRGPYKLSRSKLEDFKRCRRCFYFDRRLGIQQPAGYPFNLNSAVDALLKKEFDIHRAKGRPHPLMKQYGIDAIPFAHRELDKWREPFFGIQYLHEPTSLLITGAVDDLWINKKGELHVVDYKATSKEGEITIDAQWQDSYKRQLEIYQWLLRRLGFKVSDVGYFVYCNGRRDKAAFDGKLEFDVTIIPYRGSDRWVDGTIREAHACLQSKTLPAPDPACEFCRYRASAATVE